MGHGGIDQGVFVIIAAMGIGTLLMLTLLSCTRIGVSKPPLGREADVPIVRHTTGPAEQLTSSNLAQLRRMIEDTSRYYIDIQREMMDVRTRLGWAKVWRVFVTALLLPLYLILLLRPPLASKLFARMRRRVDALEHERRILKARREGAVLDVNFEDVAGVTQAFDNLEAAFRDILQCDAKWGVTSEWRARRLNWRSGGRSVERHPVQLRRGDSPYFRASRHALVFENMGRMIFIYPGFALMASASGDRFGLVEPCDLIVRASVVKFQEDERVPSDGQAIGYAAHKEGSLKRRFAHHRQIPIMRYGELSFHSQSGVEELYIVSRAEPCIAFARAFDALRSAIGRAGGPQGAAIVWSAPATRPYASAR